jgi:hypothetical protein
MVNSGKMWTKGGVSMSYLLEKYNKKVNYALKTKKCLEDLCSLKENGFSAFYDNTNKTYHIELISQGIKTQFTTKFDEVYAYLRENSVYEDQIKNEINSYILNRVAERIHID